MSALTLYSRPALSNWFDDFFDTSHFDRSGRSLTGSSWPRVDIQEEKERYVLHADLPGVDRKDLKITVENGTLTIAGEKKSEKKEKGDYAYYERSYGSFSRSFSLPDHVDANGIDATMKDGVLELSLKKTEAAKPKAIDVKIN